MAAWAFARVASRPQVKYCHKIQAVPKSAVSNQTTSMIHMCCGCRITSMAITTTLDAPNSR